MTNEIILPPRIAANLAKVVRETRPDIALEKLIKDYLDVKLEILAIKVDNYRSKYSMSFEDFSRACSEGTLAADPYSHEVEEDFRDWESLKSLIAYYSELNREWSTAE
ncbi:MAG: hypothetical protein ACTSP4_09090 [Candidatus Hodarchaeales archaeon]